MWPHHPFPCRRPVGLAASCPGAWPALFIALGVLLPVGAGLAQDHDAGRGAPARPVVADAAVAADAADRERELLTALEAVAATLPAAELTPVALRELARLLPDPVDQLTWLLIWAERRCAQERASDALELKQLYDATLALWNARGAALPTDELAAQELTAHERRFSEIACLRPPPPSPPPSPPPTPPPTPPAVVENVADIADPAAFRAALTPEALARLTPVERLKLIGKGVSPRRLGLRQSDPAVSAWNALCDLARAGSEGEHFWASLPQEYGMRGVALAAGGESARYRPVYALILRGLGLDGDDFQRAEIPLNNAGHWQQAAASLSAEGLWLWALAAHAAEAAAGGGASAQERGRTVQAGLEAILADNNDPDSAALRAALPRWLTGGVGGAAGERARRRTARQAAEQNLLAVWGRSADDPGGHEAVLGAMHAVKAAELGLSANPPRLAEVQQRLSERRNPQNQPSPHILFMLEAVELGGRQYGLLLFSSNCSFDQTDSFLGKKLGPEDSLAALARQARAALCPRRTGSFPGDARILILPDGSGYQLESLQQVERELQDLLNPRSASDQAWLLYGPTAAVVVGGRDWTAEQACRPIVLRNAARVQPNDNRPLLGYSAGRSPGEIRTIAAPTPLHTTCAVFVVSQAGRTPTLRPRDPLYNLLLQKKAGQADAVALFPLLVNVRP